jgi:hypothetical protein
MKKFKWSLMAALLIVSQFVWSTASASQQNTTLDLPMVINGGVDGSWVNPAANSQGFVFETIPAFNLLVAYWYTFSLNNEGREWYLATGDINGATTEMTIYRVEGGVFNQDALTEEVEAGNAILTFESCQLAQFEYTLLEEGINTQFPLQRLTPDVDCEDSLPQSQITFVSDANRWINAQGAWVFDVCVQLGANESHGREEFRFDGANLSFDIDRYDTPDCTGPVHVQTLSFELARIDKTEALLGNETVIANRVLFRDTTSGQEVKQILYFDDSQDPEVMTHGLMDGPLDSEGFPSTLPDIFAARQ